MLTMKIIAIMNDEIQHYQELVEQWRRSNGYRTSFKKLPLPPNYTTKEEVQEMIDDAIRKHNR